LLFLHFSQVLLGVLSRMGLGSGRKFFQLRRRRRRRRRRRISTFADWLSQHTHKICFLLPTTSQLCFQEKNN